jgi:hypothetical protein
MHCGLLVAYQDVLDRILLVQRVVDVQHRTARIAPEVLDLLSLQAAHEDVRAVQLLRWLGGGLRRRGAFDFRGGNIHV